LDPATPTPIATRARPERSAPGRRAGISTLLVDDHVVERQGVRMLLESEDDFTVVGEAGDGRQAVEMALPLRPDVVVMDVALPLLNGFEATKQILAAVPTMRVLVVSGPGDGEHVEHARRLGARGYVRKQAGFAGLAAAIRTVGAGKTCFPQAIAGRREPLPPARLTPREAEVLQLIAGSMANKETAARLGISVKTVEKHRQSLMAKLDIHDVAGLTRYAVWVGIIEIRNPYGEQIQPARS
jgi:DNA-binding NarL/FixJ family response regulator